ncbi:hypothetical protein TgHK011_006266 [Trichoderma gracile]|nr:hypothetical protein TgHK011_006266 [Trichoderma gracile]
MSEVADNSPPKPSENGSWLWDWNAYEMWFPEETEDVDVATIECWRYDDDQQGQAIPPIKKFEIIKFHTPAMDSWLKEPVPVVDGQHPSSGFKIVAVPVARTKPLPNLTEQENHSLNATLGLPFFDGHHASHGVGASGAFLQSDGSYVFILRKSGNTASIGTALRYDPQTNVSRGVLHFHALEHHFSRFEKMGDQFIHCSHPLLLPLLATELSFCDVMNHVADCINRLDNIEQETGYGLGTWDGEVQAQRDHRTLVRELGILQSRLYVQQANFAWPRILTQFIREKARHLEVNLPAESQSRLKIPCRMLDERAEFVLSNIECATLYGGLKERMEAQQTVLFNLIAQSDNLINIDLAKDSKEMAVASKQDSSAMKIIALLTTFFLPGTFIASFFAMPLFDWSEPTLSRVANRHFWVYWAVTGPLTLTIMAGVMAWALWNNRRVALLQSHARDSVGNRPVEDNGQNTEDDQKPGDDQESGSDQETGNEEDEGQDTDTEQSPERNAEKMGFRQKYSLRGLLRRQKRQSVTVEAEP